MDDVKTLRIKSDIFSSWAHQVSFCLKRLIFIVYLQKAKRKKEYESILHVKEIINDFSIEGTESLGDIK